MTSIMPPVTAAIRFAQSSVSTLDFAASTLKTNPLQDRQGAALGRTVLGYLDNVAMMRESFSDRVNEKFAQAREQVERGVNLLEAKYVTMPTHEPAIQAFTNASSQIRMAITLLKQEPTPFGKVLQPALTTLPLPSSQY